MTLLTVKLLCNVNNYSNIYWTFHKCKDRKHKKQNKQKTPCQINDVCHDVIVFSLILSILFRKCISSVVADKRIYIYLVFIPIVHTDDQVPIADEVAEHEMASFMDADKI